MKRAGDKIYPKCTKDAILTSYCLLTSFVVLNYSRVHEAILNERGQVPPHGHLENESAKTPSLLSSRWLLFSIITIISKGFSNVHWLFISGVALESSRQHPYNLKRF